MSYLYFNEGTDLKRNDNIEFTENARKILEIRYLQKDKEGKISETPEQMFERVAQAISEPDIPYGHFDQTKTEFYNLISQKKFFPNSPTFTGAGTPLGQLAACFVLPVSDDLGTAEDSIFSTLKAAALIQKSGGGNGFSFSKLRGKGTRISTSKGVSSGPVGFMRVYDAAFGEIAQGGSRYGANMGVLRVDHPDIREFIKCKTQEGHISNFNISVAITDEFMRAVEADTTYNIIDPRDGSIVETPKAREIFDLIVEQGYKNGEPGMLFIDTANKYNPVPHLYKLESTNPCGEQWLGPYENCCLGSINLSLHMTTDGKVDWEALRKTTTMAVRFLDNVVTANKYVPQVPKLKEAALNCRRIGLGFMGLADMMYAAGIRYGSEEAQEFVGQIMEFIRFHAMKSSIELAKERGPFPKIIGSIYDPQNMTWRTPSPLKPFTRNWGRPQLDWQEIVNGIKLYGIRNAATTTVAPTGVIATVTGVEGYGCEPVFALAYYRNAYQAAGSPEKKLTLTYVSPAFQHALDKLELDSETKAKIIERVINDGSCQNISELPEELRRVFVVSANITPDEHILTQASLQAFVDNSISKTCNFPETATREDIASVYMKGWKLGCKGLTVYITGSRKEEVLETKSTKDAKVSTETPVVEVAKTEEKIIVKPSSDVMESSEKISREYKLQGTTYKVKTPQGKAFITVNSTSDGTPFEVFINVGKAGTDVAALSEGLGRMVSGMMRLPGKTHEQVKEIISQLSGIGGSRTVGFGKNKVSSIPDAVAKVLAEEFGYSTYSNGNGNGDEHADLSDTVIVKPTVRLNTGDAKSYTGLSNVDVCPECGNYSFVQEEGCAKCYECGYSHC